MAILLYILLGVVALLAVMLGSTAMKTRALAAEAEQTAPMLGAHVRTPGGGAIHVHEKGDGPPLLMIHGAGGTLRHFTATIFDDLAADHRLIALDRPNAGYSRRDAAATGDLFDQAEAVRDVMDARGIERATVLGHSMGGSVALALALRAPERVAGLVLLAPAAAPFTPKPPFEPKLVTNGAVRALMAHTVAAPAAAKIRDAALRAVFAPDPVPTDFDAAGGGALGLRPTHIKGLMEDVIPFQEGLAKIERRVSEIAAPITAVFGAEDAIFDPEPQAAALRRAPHAQVEIWPGLGHMLPFSASQRIAAVVREAARGAA